MCISKLWRSFEDSPAYILHTNNAFGNGIKVVVLIVRKYLSGVQRGWVASAAVALAAALTVCDQHNARAGDRRLP